MLRMYDFIDLTSLLLWNNTLNYTYIYVLNIYSQSVQSQSSLNILCGK